MTQEKVITQMWTLDNGDLIFCVRHNGQFKEYNFQDIRKILLEHAEMKKLLQEINEAREAELSALSRKIRT